MTEAVGRFILTHARPDHHVETLFGETRDHGARARRVVGGVTIDQNVDVRVDVGEHSPHHVALALMPLAPHQRPGGAGDVAGAVRGVVVVDVDRGLGQRGAPTLPRVPSSLKQGPSTATRWPACGCQSSARTAIAFITSPLSKPLAKMRVSRTCRVTIAFLCSHVLAFGTHSGAR